MKYLIIAIISNLAFAKYSRSSWGYPNDKNKDCQNTRAEVLIKRSSVQVRFRDESKCYVISGSWSDYYYPQVHTKASTVEIDHLVPLFHAYNTGAKSWSKKQKKQFANDSENLVITQKKYNRSKGAKTILSWLPVNKNYACKYMQQWFKIKNKYKLMISNKEIDFLRQAKCKK